ncbi:MAG: NADH-quinone oxidoreductase subunit C [Bacteroidetes bacterium]|nr:NADH-quinone oxidoreductase subunit C [Bacteroidota bacterium]
MTFNDIEELLIHKFGQGVIIRTENTGLQKAFQVAPELIVQVCEELRDNTNNWFDYLSCLSGLDHGIEKNKFEIVYHLASIPYKQQLVLKTIKEYDRNNEVLPSFLSVSGIWRTAEWHEREVFDLMGINFDGHPDLRRILLPDDWEGYPLRKDYQAPEEYKGIKIN